MPRKKSPSTEAATTPAVPGKYVVWRDTGEKEGHGWTFDESELCAGTVKKNLYTGDYTLDAYYDNKLFVIERKGAVAELVGNLTRKEKWDDFKDELRRLEEYRYPFVLCEFPFHTLSTFPHGSGIPKSVWPTLRITPQFLLRRVEEIWFRFPRTKWLFTDTKELGRDVASGLFKRVIENAPPE